jgi:hypothetical protein
LLGLAGLLLLARRLPREGWFLLSLVVIFVVMYASLGNWIGGRSYGSRYLVVILPYLACGWAWWLSRMRETSRRLAFILVAALGIVVQLPGVLVDYAKVSQAAAAERGGLTPADRQWAWRAAPLLLNAQAAIRQVPLNVAYVTGRKAHPPIAPPEGNGDRTFSLQFAFSLDFWWLYLFYLGVLPAAAVAAVLVGAIAAGAFGLAQLSGALRGA